MPELLFGKYEIDAIVIRDKGLEPYIQLGGHQLHTHGKHANRRFKKSAMSLVERLTNKLMRTEKYNGKKWKALRVIRESFEIVEKRTKENPIQVFIRAIENAAPREETTRLFLSGIYVPMAVDSAPLRRLDVVLRNICKGAVSKSFKNKKSIEECLAEEIINAAKDDAASYAVNKMLEMERIAKSAR